jgi:hypothetical protein
VSIAVALLQGALGGAILVILVFILIVGAVVAASVFGGALGGEGTSPSSREAAPPILPPGTILAAVGLGFAWFAVYYGSSGNGFVGIMLGAMAYYRGARVLGGVVSVLSFVSLIVGHYVGDQLAQFSF